MNQRTNTLDRSHAGAGLAARLVVHATGWVSGFAAVVLLLLGGAAAETASGVDVAALAREFRLLPSGNRLASLECAERSLDDGPAADCAAALAVQRNRSEPSADGDGPAPAPERRPNWLLTSLASAGALVGSGLNSYLDGPRHSYHFSDEGWFGPNTASGGADKAAHFVDYYIVSKELANLFVVLGQSEAIGCAWRR